MSERRVIQIQSKRGEPASSPEPTAEERETMIRVTRFLERLASMRYFGKLTLSYQNGKITDLRTEQAMKIDDL